MRFEVKGEFSKKGEKKKFTKIVEVESKKLALEKTLSLLGSEHRVRRRFVRISAINELKG